MQLDQDRLGIPRYLGVLFAVKITPGAIAHLTGKILAQFTEGDGTVTIAVALAVRLTINAANKVAGQQAAKHRGQGYTLTRRVSSKL